MPLSGYEVLGNFLNNTASQYREERLKQEDEQRQERLIGEQRQYEQGSQIAAEKRGEKRQIASEGRAQQRTVEGEQRSLINGLVAGGMLAPADTENPAAVSAAFQKTTPEWRQEFEEKKQLRDEIAKYSAAGVINDVDIFSQDIDTLRTIARAAEQGAGTEAVADRGIERKYKQSIIDENTSAGAARVNAQEKANNASYWIGEADRAANEYDNAQLTPDEMKLVQATAAQAPGAEQSPELFQAALSKASDTALKAKRHAADLRYQTAQRGASIGAAIPKGGPAGNSVIGPAQTDEQKMRDFMKANGGQPGPGGASVTSPAADGSSSSMEAAATGLSMLPVERAVAAIPTISRFASVVPPVRAAIMGYGAGDALQYYFPNNPASQVGRALGTDLGYAINGVPNFGPLTDEERASVRRPLVGSSVGGPYR